jgi:hypothetical protein
LPAKVSKSAATSTGRPPLPLAEESGVAEAIGHGRRAAGKVVLCSSNEQSALSFSRLAPSDFSEEIGFTGKRA